VPKETVIADFLRSNDYILPHYEKAIGACFADGLGIDAAAEKSLRDMNLEKP
jgi:hypothetical protein